MAKPFVAPNPQHFKLYIYWFFEDSNEIVAEIPDCRWLPRIDETFVLPTDDASEFKYCHRWHKFKVVDVIYDFKKQVARIWCKPKDVPQRLEKTEIQAWLECEFTHADEEDLDEELEKLKTKILESKGKKRSHLPLDDNW